MSNKNRVREHKIFSIVSFFIAAVIALISFAPTCSFFILLSLPMLLISGINTYDYYYLKRELGDRTLLERKEKRLVEVTRKEYIPSRRSGTMVHSTTSESYIVYYRETGSEDENYYYEDEDIWESLNEGDKIYLEFAISEGLGRDNMDVKLLESRVISSAEKVF